MKRSDFIKGVIGFLGLSVLPQKMFTRYRRYYLLQSFVRGFRFYEGSQLLHQMKEGDLLELVRENNNAFDPKAIALHFNNKKIGFIPREDNDLLSRLIDADVVPLHAEITHLNKEAREWENVHIGVYVQKETNEPVATNARYLTVLETPKYRTLKINKDEVASIRYENRADEEDIIDADSFYNSIIETRKKTKINLI